MVARSCSNSNTSFYWNILVKALGGLLAGSLVTGVLMAIMMANAGGAWDNGKNKLKLDTREIQKDLTDIRLQLLEIQ